MRVGRAGALVFAQLSIVGSFPCGMPSGFGSGGSRPDKPIRGQSQPWWQKEREVCVGMSLSFPASCGVVQIAEFREGNVPCVLVCPSSSTME